MEKPSDESPTIKSIGLEIELTNAPCPADREEHHLLRLPYRWWSQFSFLFTVSSNSSSKVVVFLRQ